MTTTFDDFEDHKDRKWTYQQYDNDISNIIPGSCKVFTSQNFLFYFYTFVYFLFQSYMIINPSHIQLEQYSLSGTRLSQQNQSTGGLVSSSQWFQFGDEYQETLLTDQDYFVRDIPADAYFRSTNQTTIQVPSPQLGMISYTTQYNMTYFFSKKNSWSFFGNDINDNQIPLRLTVKGYSTVALANGTQINSHTFDHNYEYVSFKTGDNAFDANAVEFIPGLFY